MPTLKGATHQAQVVGRFDERAVWEALLKQAEANLAISNAILAHTQRVICAETTDDMEPDQLESWYCADGDA